MEQLNPKGEEPLEPLWLALFPPLLAGKKNKGEDDATRCNLATFVKDLFEFLLTALHIGFLRDRQTFASVSSYNGAKMFGAPSPRARTDARTHALKHALMHSHAAQICAGYSSLAAQRDELEKQLQQPDLSAAEQASLEKELDDVQTKISAGGKALPTERAELMASPDLHAVGS